MSIAREEGADAFVVELQLCCTMWPTGNSPAATTTRARGRRQRVAYRRSALIRLSIDHVAGIIAGLSFKGAGVETPMSTHRRPLRSRRRSAGRYSARLASPAHSPTAATKGGLYDPAIPPQPHASFEAYKKNAGPTINHFYEKLLLLKDRMNTGTGKRLAAERHAFWKCSSTSSLPSGKEKRLNYAHASRNHFALATS